MARTDTAWRLTKWLLRWLGIVFLVAVAWMFANALIYGPDPEPKDGSVLHKLVE